MQTYLVEQSAPLLDALVQWTGNRTQAKKWLKFRQVTVNGVTAERHDLPLKPGDAVAVSGEKQPNRGGHILGIPLVYEDDAILVIDKPQNLLTIATDADKSKTAYHEVYEYVKSSSFHKGDRIFIVHRLDRETSGLLLFARTAEAKQALQSNWESVEKRYLAIVKGFPAECEATLISHLTESKALRVYSGPETPQSRRAVTHYKLLKTGRTTSLLEVRLETGRKHQIRVQLADAGYPVVGDDKYGGHKGPGRLALHASALVLPHPITGEPLSFESSLPRSMAVLLK